MGSQCKPIRAGLATEISRAMLRHGFVELGLHRIFAQCRAENLASRRLMSKLGMREEGCCGRMSLLLR